MDKSPKFRYTAVTGFFLQDTQPAGPTSETTTLPGLGLISQPYESDSTFDPDGGKTGWERFAHYLDHLNRNSHPGTKYKLIYAARHGQGYHNVKESEVGTEAWESYWAKLDGDGKTVWSDAHLTPAGEAQAAAMKSFWEDTAAASKLPLPRRHYASPHARCLETCRVAFTGLAPPTGDADVPPFHPLVRELIRERLGVHTCDRRSTRSWIHKHYPEFALEEDFSEPDPLWNPDVRETLSEHVVRVEAFLDDLFTNDSEPIVSATIHSGTIMALYAAIGHAEVRVAPGSIVPVLVKAEPL